MRKGIFITLLVFMSLSQLGQTGVKNLCKGIFPENTMRIPVGAIHANNMTLNEFDEVLTRLQKIYDPDFAALGATFKIERDWDNEEVNAYADRTGKTWLIHMFGGMARHPKLTGDGFALVACHEIGHHLGGAPKFSADWASVEGEMISQTKSGRVS